MPRGVYPRRRTAAQIASWQKNFAKGRTKEAHQKAATTRKQIVCTEEWRRKVSEATRNAMQDPKVKEKHRLGIERAIATHGVGFKGGQHQPPLPLILDLEASIADLGFVREFKIKTKGHGTSMKTRGYLLVDFGHEEMKVAVEIDGPSHRSRKIRERDERKRIVLAALGWVIVRFTNDEAKHKQDHIRAVLLSLVSR